MTRIRPVQIVSLVLLAAAGAAGCGEPAAPPRGSVYMGLLVGAKVFVTDEAKLIDEVVAVRSAAGPQELRPTKAWQEVSSDRPVVLEADRKLAFMLSAVDDWRWTTPSRPRLQVEGSRLVFLVQLYGDPGPHILNYMPSDWHDSVVSDGLPAGLYKVFVDKTFIGKLRLGRKLRS